MRDILIKESIVPNYRSSNILANTLFTYYLNIKNIPLIGLGSDLGRDAINTFFNYPNSLFSGMIALDANASYRKTMSTFRIINNKIQNLFTFYKNDIDDLLDTPCFTFSTDAMNFNKNKSTCSLFGSYVALPYIGNSAKTFTGDIALTASTSNSVSASNLQSVHTLPFSTLPCLEVYTSGQVGTVTFNISLSVPTTMNAFYIKLSNFIKGLSIKIGNFSTTVKSNEAFVSFTQQTNINNISITANIVNNNISKPVGISISDCIVFQNIIFTQRGSYESLPQKAVSLKRANNIIVNGDNIADLSVTNISKGISIELKSEANPVFIKTENSQNIQVSGLALQHFFSTNETGADITYLENNLKEIRLPYSVTDIDKQAAKLYCGMNDSYLANTTSFRNQNWITDGNYYKTNIYNQAENLTINIGTNKITLNGITASGKVSIPKGMSSIRAHEMYFDFTINPLDSKSVLSDKLYPNNMAYLLEGLPSFSASGDASRKTKKFSSGSGNGTFDLGEGILPYRLGVLDSGGREYFLHLGESPGDEGTFCVNQKTGTIRVNMYQYSQQIVISYYASSLLVPSAGVTFASLLTYQDIKTLALDSLTPSFTIISDADYDYLILNNVKGYEAATNKYLMYNKNSDTLYTSLRVDMETKNKYISPAIKNVYVTVK